MKLRYLSTIAAVVLCLSLALPNSAWALRQTGLEEAELTRQELAGRLREASAPNVFPGGIIPGASGHFASGQEEGEKPSRRAGQSEVSRQIRQVIGEMLSEHGKTEVVFLTTQEVFARVSARHPNIARPTVSSWIWYWSTSESDVEGGTIERDVSAAIESTQPRRRRPRSGKYRWVPRRLPVAPPARLAPEAGVSRGRTTENEFTAAVRRVLEELVQEQSDAPQIPFTLDEVFERLQITVPDAGRSHVATRLSDWVNRGTMVAGGIIDRQMPADERQIKAKARRYRGKYLWVRQPEALAADGFASGQEECIEQFVVVGRQGQARAIKRVAKTIREVAPDIQVITLVVLQNGNYRLGSNELSRNELFDASEEWPASAGFFLNLESLLEDPMEAVSLAAAALRSLFAFGPDVAEAQEVGVDLRPMIVASATAQEGTIRSKVEHFLGAGQEERIRAALNPFAQAAAPHPGALVIPGAGLEEHPHLIRLALHREFAKRMIVYGAVAVALRKQLDDARVPVIEEKDFWDLVGMLWGMDKADRITVLEKSGTLAERLKKELPPSMTVRFRPIGAAIKLILSAFFPEEELDQFDDEAFAALAHLFAT